MAKRKPFGSQGGKDFGARAQRRAAQSGKYDAFSAPGYGLRGGPLPQELVLPVSLLDKLDRSVYIFYDNAEERNQFLLGLNQYIAAYSSSARRPLPMLELALRGITLPELRRICEEEQCDAELLAQCHFLEIYKVCPGDLVLASGVESQKLLEELKVLAYTQPDSGARFFTLREVMALTGRPGDMRDMGDRMVYYAAITERLYAE